MWHDGLHIYYSETTVPDMIEFHGEPHNYYVIEYSPCSSGICIESYQVGQVEAFSKHFILTNGCAK